MKKPILALKALRELPPRQIWLYILYQLGLKTGYLRWATRNAPHYNRLSPGSFDFQPLLELPSPEELASVVEEAGKVILLREADEIVDGQARLFGGDPVPLRLIPPLPLQHWTSQKNKKKDDHRNQEVRESEIEELKSQDIKFIWEPCRFGWAFILGRAYHISGKEDYAAAFWKYTETFLDNNPAYQGPNWASGQEAALRLISFVFSLQIFQKSQSSTPERQKRLLESIAAHAARIPPTLIYAHAQNNNHLLSEAAGLYTAGLALPEHPQAQKWRSLGWYWFNKGIQEQIASDGTYIQHSTNYHRVMLQLALWISHIGMNQKHTLPNETKERLTAATRWLYRLMDKESGWVPNLGANDGANILPFTICPFKDYRPVIQTAANTFLGTSPIQPGVWDEMVEWIGSHRNTSESRESIKYEALPTPNAVHGSPTIILSPDKHSWAYLRVARFAERPGHADQLHLDLWWRGLNIAQDAGTFLYNAPSPWNNTLARTEVHNTLLINHHDQMTQVGRFLFLDWAQAKIISSHITQDSERQSLIAQHDGYRQMGVMHQREVITNPDSNWVVKDRVIPKNHDSPYSKKNLTVTLHWLLPDCSWNIITPGNHLQPQVKLNLKSPQGDIALAITSQQDDHPKLHMPQYQLARAGKLIHGKGSVSPTLGWSSPTYGVRIPALSFRITVSKKLPITFISEWSFPSQLE